LTRWWSSPPGVLGPPSLASPGFGLAGPKLSFLCVALARTVVVGRRAWRFLQEDWVRPRTELLGPRADEKRTLSEDPAAHLIARIRPSASSSPTPRLMGRPENCLGSPMCRCIPRGSPLALSSVPAATRTGQRVLWASLGAAPTARRPHASGATRPRWQSAFAHSAVVLAKALAFRTCGAMTHTEALRPSCGPGGQFDRAAGVYLAAGAGQDSPTLRLGSGGGHPAQRRGAPGPLSRCRPRGPVRHAVDRAVASRRPAAAPASGYLVAIALSRSGRSPPCRRPSVRPADRPSTPRCPATLSHPTADGAGVFPGPAGFSVCVFKLRAPDGLTPAVWPPPLPFDFACTRRQAPMPCASIRSAARFPCAAPTRCRPACRRFCAADLACQPPPLSVCPHPRHSQGLHPSPACDLPHCRTPRCPRPCAVSMPARARHTAGEFSTADAILAGFAAGAVGGCGLGNLGSPIEAPAAAPLGYRLARILTRIGRGNVV